MGDMHWNEAVFAREALRAYQLYSALAEKESDPQFRLILDDLAHTSRDQFDFWARKSAVRGDEAIAPFYEIWFYRAIRLVFGVKYACRRIRRRKEHRVEQYMSYCATCTVPNDSRTVETFAQRLQAIIERLPGA